MGMHRGPGRKRLLQPNCSAPSAGPAVLRNDAAWCAQHHWEPCLTSASLAFLQGNLCVAMFHRTAIDMLHAGGWRVRRHGSNELPGCNENGINYG